MKRWLVPVLLAAAGGFAAAQAAPPAANWRCGGVGQDEQQEFKAAAARHDALLTFAAAGGAYLADVDVEVRDSRGELVLQANCDGPLMLLDLPARGLYQVTASVRGKAQRRPLKVGGKGARAVFVWPAQ